MDEPPPQSRRWEVADADLAPGATIEVVATHGARFVLLVVADPPYRITIPLGPWPAAALCTAMADACAYMAGRAKPPMPPRPRAG
jgi:hypothetical protein